MTRLPITLGLLAALAAACGVAPGQVPPPTKDAPPNAAPAKHEIPVTKLALVPAAAPTPVLRYSLLPPERKRVSGNAALSYSRAFLMLTERRSGMDPKAARAESEQMDKWEQMPLKDLPVKEVRSALISYRGILRELEDGAHCDRCDWQLERRIYAEGIGLLLPEVQKARESARVLRMQVRVALAERNFDEALGHLQTGFALARGVGEGPTLIHSLVGMALTAIFCGEIDQLAQQPGAPNLYWALTALPRPFIDLRKPMLGEASMLDATLPELREVDKGPMSTERAQKLLDRVVLDLARLIGDEKPDLARSRLLAAGWVALQFPNAKKSLLARGRTEAELDVMPAAQVVMLDSVLRFYALRDELFVWFFVPYPEAQEGLRRANEKIRRVQKSGGDMFTAMLSLLLPAVEKVHFAAVRTERRLAGVRAVEAIRLYAAAHDGKLPAKLADIDEVPIPEDPFNGKPFEYRVEGDRAILTAPPPPGEKPIPTGNTLRYEMNLKK